MVDDILLSPEEQDERAKQWLKDNGMSIVIGVLVGIGLIFGINQYRDKQKVQAELASDLYHNVETLSKDNNLADINDSVTKLKQDFATSAYSSKAVLINAKQLAVSDLDAAAAELKWVLENAPEIGLKHTARIRLAQIYLSQDDTDQAEKYANYAEHGGFESYYFELQGDVATQKDQHDKARGLYQQAIEKLSSSGASYKSVIELKINQLPSADKE